MSEQRNPKNSNSPVERSVQPSAKSIDSSVEKLRINAAFRLSIGGLGLAAVLVIVLVAVGWSVSSDIVAVVGLFTSILGALVGTFFGVQIGAGDKARAEERADNAQKKIDALTAAADSQTLEKAKGLYQSLFQ